jgi:hypothetical protein
LIAEEVAKVYPELVVNGADGKPQTVAYHLLPAMLLNELQKQARANDRRDRELAQKDTQISALRQEVQVQSYAIAAVQKTNLAMATRLDELERQASASTLERLVATAR